MDVGGWLRELGLSQYQQTFRDNAIDADVLLELTDSDLANLGVVLGHRKRILKAIAALATPSAAASTTTEARHSSVEEAQRRQLTVMFCDVVGSTALAARLDPEDLRDIIGIYQARVGEVVRQHEGFIAKYMGDGVLVYFGYPNALENDAERAVRAGLALVDAIARLQASQPLQIRIGIATGLVVVGDLIGSGASQERGVVGETPNLAARLQQMAEPNSIVICAGTRKLTAGLFEYTELGAIEAKGFGPLTAWRVLRESTITSRFDALRVARIPLVGRGEEIDLLARRWVLASSGEGQAVLISGEPGIGKSRLTAAIKEHSDNEPRTCLQYFCAPHMSGSVLFPILTQIEHAAGLERSEDAAKKLDKIEALLALSSENIVEDAALLADFLAIPSDQRYPRVALSAQRRKELLLERLCAQIEGLAKATPVLMIFEDAHWMDPTSLELLELIIRRIEALPVLVVITYRPGFLAPWIGQPHVTVLTLARLRRRDNEAMLARLTGGRPLPAELVEQILARTDGVPLFVEELTKSVLESGVLREEDGRLMLSGPLPPLAVPTSLQASLAARLDRLAPVRNVAQTGAALGREFSYEIMREVVDLPELELRSALERLVAAELVTQRGVVPDTIYTFKHALLQDAAYETLLRSQRVVIHSRVVDVLKRKFPETARQHPDLLAHHATEAGLWESAIGFRLEAARKVLARSAAMEASGQVERGRALLSRVDPGEARDALDYRLQLTSVDTLKMLKGLMAPEAGATLVALRDHPGRRPNSTEDLRAMCGLWSYHWLGGKLRAGLGVGEQLLNESADPCWSTFAHYMLGSAKAFMGDIPDGTLHLERTVEGARKSEFASFDYILGYNTEVDALDRLAIVFAAVGRFDEAQATAHLSIDKARQTKHPFTLAVALVNCSRVFWMLDDVDTVAEFATEGASLSAGQKFAFYTARCEQLLGWVDVRRGAAGGLERMESGLSAARAMGARLWDAHFLPVLASCHLLAGRLARAEELMAEAAAEMEETEERFWEAELWRVFGDVKLAAGFDGDAAVFYERALAVALEQDARLWQVKAATSLARWRLSHGDPQPARAILAPVRDRIPAAVKVRAMAAADALLREIPAEQASALRKVGSIS